MLLYVGVAIWPLIIQWIYQHKPISIKNKKISRNSYLIIALLPIFVLLALRAGNMGADTGVYTMHFTNMINTPLKSAFEMSRMEKGYLVYVKVLTYITNNPLVYQIICVFIYIIGLRDFLRFQDNDSEFMFLFMYCTLGLFFFMFTGVRQCIAMSICLFSYKYIDRKQLIRFSICLILAFFFHKSAILFIVVPLIIRRKISILNTTIYFVAALIAGRYLNVIQDWFNNQFDYAYGIENIGSGMVFLLVLIVLTVFSLVMIYNQYGSLNVDERTKALININFITLFFWIMRLQTRVAERPSYYFMFFSCALYAYALNGTKDKHKPLYLLLVGGCLLLLFIYRLKTNFSSLIPYTLY